MRILFDHPNPFLLAHGGFQIQIEQTQAALRAIGLEVEPLRWWDDQQTGNIIHYFGRIPAGHIEFAHRKGFKVVMAELLTAQGSRSQRQLKLQKAINGIINRIAPDQFLTSFKWKSYRLADACVAGTGWEAHLMSYLFGAPREKVHIVPNGVEEIFLNSVPVPRKEWLVCTATITERKRVLELAQSAVRAKRPVWIIGKSYSENDSYAQKFFSFARENPDFVRYEGPVSERHRLAQVYREARGFVLLSTMETRSLAAEEAAACECPLLLSDLPWARSVFNENASYCPAGTPSDTASCLREFYDAAPSLNPPLKPLTWIAVAQQLKSLYESLLRTS